MMTEGEPETSIERYLQVISSKTAVLFAAACELGAVVSGRVEWEQPLRRSGIYTGIAFQLIDDALDYSADQEQLGKTVGDDFREGKITLPVILSYNNGTYEEKAFWSRTLSELQQQPEDLETARLLMDKYDALQRTVTMAERYCARARQLLDAFPSSPQKAAMVDIVDICVSRAY